jgi:hypothetical protein
MMFKLKPVLNYLGAGNADLNARIDARCPSCSPANNPEVLEATCPAGSDFAANVGPVNYYDGLISPTQMSGIIFAEGLVWVKILIPGLGLRYLKGFNPLTGALVRTIDMFTLTGSKYVSRTDMAVDSSGNIWVGYIDDAGAATEYKLFIFNPTTLDLVSSLFQEKNEMWGCRGTGYGLVVYNAATGVLSQTLGAPMMSISFCRYIPEKKTMLMTGSQGTEVWSTETYTRVGYILDTDLDPSTDVGYHLTGYNPASDEYFGVGFDLITPVDDFLAFVDADTLTPNTPYDGSLPPAGATATATVLAGQCACYAIFMGPATDDYLVRVSR